MRRTARLSLLALVLALLPARLYATDLAVSKTADQETAAVGDTITFTLVVDNTSTFGGGPLPSTVDLFDRFSNGLTWLDIAGDITVADCEAIAEGGGFDCRFDMEAGEVKTATVTFVVTEAGEQTNAVSVAPTIGDPDPSDNEAEAVVTVADPSQAELHVMKTAEEDTVGLGETVTFTIDVENVSSVEAEDVMLTDLSDAAKLQYESASAGCRHEVAGTSNIVDCDLGNLAPGETATVEVMMMVLELGEIENLVAARASNTSGEVTDEVTVTAERPFVRAFKEADVEGAQIGDLITYTLTIRNWGNVTASDLTLQDVADAPLSFVESSGACAPGVDHLGRPTIDCPVGDLEPGESFVVTHVYRYTRETRDPQGLVRNDAVARAPYEEAVNGGLPWLSRDIAAFQGRDYEPEAVHWWNDFPLEIPVKRSGQQGGVDIYVDSLLAAENLEPGHSTPVSNVRVRSISPTFHVVPAGGTLADAILVEQVDFFTGEITGDDFRLTDAYVLLLVGPEESPTLLLQRDARFEAQDPAQVDVFFAHAAPDAPALHLRRFGTGEMLAPDLASGTLTGYTPLTPASYAVEVVDAEGEVLDVFEVDLSDRQGEGLGVIVVPGGSGGADEVALVVLDADGTITTPDVVTETEETEVPARFALHGNYPNPFNPTTTLRFDLPETATVYVAVYDVLGRQVLTLTPGRMAAGMNRTLALDARSLSSGTYLYYVLAEGTAQTYRAAGRFVVIQ